ncbi:16S rRNA (cytosine(1402)-N(4))-methyltransferase RsmH [Weeksella virosa]|uniref:Ribosomal RNA small subunit methyltransferase H n=1 Tax=Weeksella virosa (strain ATCC 43766 / DSM 16922 / JCM 21250 / CCUG 30538 / CDC 9751 / IAM 14551 / NBRC 16016 / NCTC 11634 / CL345/78) TaxID=865938 RepID=F0P059_WEEVC|nr:16S rRNA (cytosine(1402)-N(4))-methyltransferase RsmH [Weeksella virosa]ADX67406.1 Ribosomal RNA small subunit methyltransferase H [Weeksella virosa DSM 16922]MDK7675687.1 16S rRNA (cytosine(1402)-N(4))-methyltransferase RsmH [Weeksella virosa]SUP53697.1 Ribosomal RNA small subunit methyltransferase H [Weeksella virosa]VEH62853.1 Ribosomal RNA small subunit methyltransferase H [Weeksella virosa]
MMNSSYHNPVLLQESVDALVVNPSGVYVDCTFGGGGHSREILSRLDDNGRLYAFDQDEDAKQNKIEDERFELIDQNFRYLKNNLRFRGVKQVDGILADLGVSSHQFDTPERGFSIRFDGELDMRMNINSSLSAKNIVNEYDEDQLADIFYNYGELKGSRRLASEIIKARNNQSIETIEHLKDIFSFIPKNKENKFFAQVFQALRIEVNDEMAALREMLLQSGEIVRPEGRLVVISYHSLEDRLVKRYMRNGVFEGEPERDIYGNWSAPFKPLQSKVIVPSEKEIEENSRARSAKMRIAVKY